MVLLDHQLLNFLLHNEHLSLPNNQISLVITHAEKERFDKKYPLKPTHNSQADYPGEPGEQPLISWKKIADFFDKHPDTIRKEWSKEADFPINKRGDEVWAYPTQLTRWLDNRIKAPRNLSKTPFSNKD